MCSVVHSVGAVCRLLNVGVGTPVSRGPRLRTGRALLAHPAPTVGSDDEPYWLVVSARAHFSCSPGSASGACFAPADSPWQDPFPPSPPPPNGYCSETSSVLWVLPTSGSRSSVDCALGLPTAPQTAICLGNHRISRVPCRECPCVLEVYDRVGLPQSCARLTAGMLPSVLDNAVGAPN